MAGEYEFGEVIIPRAACQKNGAPRWLQSIEFCIDCTSSYEWSFRRWGISSRAGACNYVDGLADMIGVLYEHYDALPVIYFDLLDKAMQTLKTSPLSKNPVWRDMEIRENSRCLQKAALILRVANDKESITERLQKQLSPRWLKYWQSLQRKSERAARTPYREYLSSLCRRFGGDSRDSAIGNAYRDLENSFKQPNSGCRSDLVGGMFSQPAGLRRRHAGNDRASFFSGIKESASKVVSTVRGIVESSSCKLD